MRDRTGKPLNIGDKVTFYTCTAPKGSYTRSSKIIGFTSTGNVIVRGDLIHDDEVVSPSDCMKWE